MLDIGANADCKPEVLAEFAELGSLYTKFSFGIDNPKVALLNIGEEEQKGSTVVQAAHQLLKINKKNAKYSNITKQKTLWNSNRGLLENGNCGCPRNN